MLRIKRMKQIKPYLSLNIECTKNHKGTSGLEHDFANNVYILLHKEVGFKRTSPNHYNENNKWTYRSSIHVETFNDLYRTCLDQKELVFNSFLPAFRSQGT